MNKPFTIQVQETEQKIVESLNNSQLPVYVLKNILINMINQLEKIDKEEIDKYKEEMEKESEKKCKK